MNKRHEVTPAMIFQTPTAAGVRWHEIEALFHAIGAEISEGAGSRVRVALRGPRPVFHRPHPGPETARGAVRAVRDFLIATGFRPSKN